MPRDIFTKKEDFIDMKLRIDLDGSDDDVVEFGTYESDGSFNGGPGLGLLVEDWEALGKPTDLIMTITVPER